MKSAPRLKCNRSSEGNLAPLRWLALISLLVSAVDAANLPAPSIEDSNILAASEIADADVRVDCNSDEIVVSISTTSGKFNGMVYPRGLSKNTHCMGEWVQRTSPIAYTLPLRGCNTMSTDLDDGGIEYYNTIVVQPHLKLVTNQGKGFHIRCRYKTRNNTIPNDSLKVDSLSSDPVTSMATMPGCSMKIFAGEPSQHHVAENVKIGDPLSLVVAIDEQETYGIRVTDCVVKDGLGWGEQTLIDSDGCPTDPDIMGMFQYSGDFSKAEVQFKAHKFPYIASVYYQCNVRLCVKANNGCDKEPLTCRVPSSSSSSVDVVPERSNRLKRQAVGGGTSSSGADPEGTPATIEVYSGLYVNEANDLAKAGQDDYSVFSEKAPEDAICISQRSFAIGICVAGLILMLCVIAAILCLLARRRKKTVSNPGSSIYSGPYTNTAYSHTS
ncbi:cuticlin-4 isoform X2 [Cylas formicarius]|uniref:cuticlin-4 isoform X2 n=1 Tax=Cylas formicarius TaxID=197179 RepID=UPI002958DD4A|nr:cuticlin-4 isoform X2 [Cylas formicarius]